jgi:hypothetical protein
MRELSTNRCPRGTHGRTVRVLLLSAALAGCVAAESTSAAGQCQPPHADSIITRTLASGPGERVSIASDSSPTMYPGVLFREGHRIPRATSFEESRPKSATVVIRGPDCVLVSSFSDLPRAWVLATQGEMGTVASARARVPALAVLTGLLTSRQLLSTSEQAREQLSSGQLDTLAALGRPFAPPSAVVIGDTVSVSFFGDLSAGIYQFDFSIPSTGTPSIRWAKVLSTSGL